MNFGSTTLHQNKKIKSKWQIPVRTRPLCPMPRDDFSSSIFFFTFILSVKQIILTLYTTNQLVIRLTYKIYMAHVNKDKTYLYLTWVIKIQNVSSFVITSCFLSQIFKTRPSRTLPVTCICFGAFNGSHGNIKKFKLSIIYIKVLISIDTCSIFPSFHTCSGAHIKHAT